MKNLWLLSREPGQRGLMAAAQLRPKRLSAARARLPAWGAQNPVPAALLPCLGPCPPRTGHRRPPQPPPPPAHTVSPDPGSTSFPSSEPLRSSKLSPGPSLSERVFTSRHRKCGVISKPASPTLQPRCVSCRTQFGPAQMPPARSGRRPHRFGGSVLQGCPSVRCQSGASGHWLQIGAPMTLFQIL